jgi:hypothetical protein
MVKSRVFTGYIATIALIAALAVAGCHSNTPSGVYTDSTGRITLEFKDGKAFLNLGGVADPDGTPYDVNGTKLTIHYPSDGMLAPYSNMTINSDGSLQGGMGTFKKK